MQLFYAPAICIIIPLSDDSLRLRSRNRLYPPNLYKGIFWWGNPKMIYFGMQDQYYTFNMFRCASFGTRVTTFSADQAAAT